MIYPTWQICILNSSWSMYHMLLHVSYVKSIHVRIINFISYFSANNIVNLIRTMKLSRTSPTLSGGSVRYPLRFFALSACRVSSSARRDRSASTRVDERRQIPDDSRARQSSLALNKVTSLHLLLVFPLEPTPVTPMFVTKFIFKI